MWDLTLAMIECMPSGNGVPLEVEGLCVGAKQVSICLAQRFTTS